MNRKQTELEMIQDPDRWPRFPFLPLTRGNEAAFVVCSELEGRLEGEIAIWLGNIWQPVPALADKNNRVVYENAKAVIDDGWRVD